MDTDVNLFSGTRQRALCITSLLASCLLMSGCAEESGTDTPGLQGTPLPVGGFEDGSTLSARWVGRVFIDESRSKVAYDTGVYGRFLRQEDPLSIEQLVASYSPVLETCDYPAGAELPPQAQGLDLSTNDLSAPDVGAGDAMILLQPSGTWLSVQKTLDNQRIRYELVGNEVPQPIPAQLSVAVSGDQFPPMPTMPLPEVEPMGETVPEASMLVTPVTEWSWMPGSSETAYIRITLTTLESADNPLPSLIACSTVDDGNFSLPAAVREALGNNLIGYRSGVTRVEGSIGRSGDAALYLERTSTN